MNSEGLGRRLVRPEIAQLSPPVLKPTPRDWTRLHANENPYPFSPRLNCYPEPYPLALEAVLAQLYGTKPECVLATRGSDEGIDLLVRAFCAAERDAVMTFSPTFGMYEISARIQGARVIDVPTSKSSGFAVDSERIAAAWQPGTKLIFLCSPNNPTGNSVPRDVVTRALEEHAQDALVVLDEAYIEFSAAPSFALSLDRYPNLVVLRTLSKAHGLAGARCGAVLASADIMQWVRRIRPPYALPAPTDEEAQTLLLAERQAHFRSAIARILAERERMRVALARVPGVTQVWPSDANFLLVETETPSDFVERATRARILVRDFHETRGLEGCLRISMGTEEQNTQLLAALESS